MTFRSFIYNTENKLELRNNSWTKVTMKII